MQFAPLHVTLVTTDLVALTDQRGVAIDGVVEACVVDGIDERVRRVGRSGAHQGADGDGCAETGGSEESLHSSEFLSFELFAEVSS
jgi:hypothetical protein